VFCHKDRVDWRYKPPAARNVSSEEARKQ